MNIKDAFPSSYFCTDDFDPPQTLTISRVMIEDFGGQKDAEHQRPVAYFKEDSKGFVLNRTNFRTLAELHGDDSGEWTGKCATFFKTTTLYRGERVACTRVRAVDETPEPGHLC